MTVSDPNGADPILEAHRCVGRRLAEAVFRKYPNGDAPESHIFAVEKMFHDRGDAFLLE